MNNVFLFLHEASTLTGLLAATVRLMQQGIVVPGARRNGRRAPDFRTGCKDVPAPEGKDNAIQAYDRYVLRAAAGTGTEHVLAHIRHQVVPRVME